MGRKTQIFEFHRGHGNIVDYAGFDLPVWFEGIIPECTTVRNRVGIFDVSHMGRVLVEGPDAASFLNKMTTNDVSSLALGRGHYSLFCNPTGGIIDDLTVFRIASSKFLIVYNAGNREKDWNWLQKNKGSSKAALSDVSDQVAMFAVQGPKAGGVLRNISAARLDEIEKYGTKEVKVMGLSCLVTRSGYTGEDGFEIYVWDAPVNNPSNALAIWDMILAEGKEYGIRPVGLGARDVLRLEAGMCLYGNDMDEKTSPVEAKLNWVVRLEKSGFLGEEAIRRLKAMGPDRIRVGFRLTDKGIPRQGQEIRFDDEIVGKISSGTFSPTLRVGLGMGFVKPSHAAAGEKLSIMIRGRNVPAEIVKLPFYQRRSEEKMVVFGEEMGLKDFRAKFN
jgi:aminomethyltransferase